MHINLVPSNINNNILRKCALCFLVAIQIFLLVHLSKSSSAKHGFERKNTKTREISVDFEFDEDIFYKIKEDLKEEILSKFNDDPKEAFKELRQKLSREEKNIKILNEQINHTKKTLSKFEASSLLNRVKGAIFSRRKRSIKVNECPNESPKLLGDILIQQEDIPELKPNTTGFTQWYGPLLEGGVFETSECITKQKVAIIIPFRDREEHLKIWLYNMHPILQRQQIDYQIFVIEQVDEHKFNRGALMNVGYREATTAFPDMGFNCFIFQDVDLIPENDGNLYTCMDGNQVKHMAVAVSKWKYKLIYENYFGGVTALSKEQFNRINGFANGFYGWGGEDDDFYRRISRQNLTIFRYPGYKSRYTMLKHNFVESDGDEVTEMTKKSENGKLNEDGLSNLRYDKVNENRLPLYTKVTVRLPHPPKSHKIHKNILESGANFLLNGINGLINNVASQYVETDGNEDTIY